MTEPVHRPPLVYVVRRVEYARIRALDMEAAMDIAETLDEWSAPEYDIHDVIEEQP